MILDSLVVSDSQIRIEMKKKTEKKDGLYCVYLGIAKKSLHQRIIKMHLKQDIKRSTLRWSLSAVFNLDSKDENAISSVLENFSVEWVEFTGSNPSLEQKEEFFINEYFRILNGAKNRHKLNDVVKAKRRILRKEKKYW